jgi:hypothetical protein
MRESDGSVMYPSSLGAPKRSEGGSSPYQPSAQMGDWQSMSPTPENHSGECQSPICADLSSESPSLRGESYCAAGTYRMQVGRGLPRTLAKSSLCGPLSGLLGW